MGSVFSVVLLLGGCTDATGTADPDLFFPTAGDSSGAMMAALYSGRLVVRADCLLLVSERGDFFLPIWRDGSTAERDGSGRLVVRDVDVDVIAVEGDAVELGGGAIAEFRPTGRTEPRDAQLAQVEELTGVTIPDRCLGPDVSGVWWVSAG